jgi:hypothetical protein
MTRQMKHEHDFLYASSANNTDYGDDLRYCRCGLTESYKWHINKKLVRFNIACALGIHKFYTENRIAVCSRCGKEEELCWR